MKFRGTLIALALVVGLGTYVFVSERRERRALQDRASLEKLVPLEAGDVESLAFAYGDKRQTLVRRGQGWVLVEPVSAPGDAEMIAAFLDTLVTARIEDRVGRGNVARYGLDHPAATAVIQSRGDQSHKLEFGRINPMQTLAYVRVDDDPEVLLTTSSLLTYSLTSTFGWRDKRMITLAPEQVDRIRFSTINAGSLIVRRDARSRWITEGGTPWRVDPVKMRGLLLQLTGLEAVGVADENKAALDKYGLGNRRMSTVLEDSTGLEVADLIFGFALREGSYYAIVPDKPEVFEVDGQLVESLNGLVRRPQDVRVFPQFDPSQITRIDVKAPAEAFVLERSGMKNWKVLSSDKVDSTFVVDPGRVQALLEQLATAEITEFPTQQPERSVVEPPEWSVDLWGPSGLLSGVRIGRRDPRAGLHTFAYGLGDRAVFLVSPAVLINLPFEIERLGTGEFDVPLDTEQG
jgi:hypothetical protein